MKKILIISNYFPPEIGAASNRIKNLADGLVQSGNNVEIVCPIPNYPLGKIFKAYKGQFRVYETSDGIKIRRFWLYPSTSENFLLRFFSMISFSISLWMSFFTYIRKKPDLIIIQSPPLFIALSGLLLSKCLRCKNILNVSDLWPLSALELGAISKGFFYRVLEVIEKINYKLADKIVGQSDEIISHIQERTKKSFLVYRNVPKLKVYQPKKEQSKKVKIVYAGLLGLAQGVFALCNSINFKELDVEFHIYGAGMEEININHYAENELNNIYFHGSKTSKEIKEILLEYDIGLVPLKNRIFGAVPSKIFEMIQIGLPVLYFGEGEAADLISKNNIGFHCKSKDYEELTKLIIHLKNLSRKEYAQLSENGVEMHKNEYNLEHQLIKFNKFII